MTSSTACPDENALSAWAVGACSPDEAQSMTVHVEGCERCREAFAEVVKSLRVDEEALTTPSRSTPTAKGDPLPISPGDVLLGKYQIVDVLGSGGMGVVVRARHLQLNGFVALKFIRPELANDADVVSRFSREARAASRLKSPHANRVLDLGVLPSGVPFMVMEYLEGETLESRLTREGKQPLQAVIGWAKQALSGLSEAHALGIVHRDLKPANLFLQAREGGAELLTILDFGVAKSVNPDIEAGLQQTTMRGFVGSPGYMAPEQLTAGAAIDARADFWALGCTMYRLLTGELAFRGADLVDLGWNIRNAPTPTLPAALGPDMQACLERCLAKAPGDRYANTAQLLAALDAIALESPRPSRAKRWAAASALGLVAAAALATFAFAPKPVPIAVNVEPVKALPPPPPVDVPKAIAEVPPAPVVQRPIERKPVVKTAPIPQLKQGVIDAGASDGVFDERL